MSNAIASIAFWGQKAACQGPPETPTLKGEKMSARNHDLHLRLNDDEYDKLCNLVSKSGLSREAYLRQLIAGIQPKELPPPDFYPMMRQLYYCGNNLNQISRKAHALNVIDVQKYDEAVSLFQTAVQEMYRAVLEPEKLSNGHHKNLAR